MYDERHFTRDAATVSFHDDASGITHDDDGQLQIDWSEVERVRVDDPPHADHFGTKEFYRLPATVARPIPQPYRYGEDTFWLKKPREELKKAAWSLDNAPWTHDHPDTGMVKSTDDIRGFWSNPRYIDGTDDFDADLNVPVDDEESKRFLEENSDVSIGFYNRIDKIEDYDGVVGGSDADGVELDGYQTDIYINHGASVKVGRCPGSKGCGLDDRSHGCFGEVNSFKRDIRTTDINEDSKASTDGMKTEQTLDQPDGIFVNDSGKWFAVGPDEHTKDSTDYEGDGMFVVDTCADISDAWNLRNHAKDLSIELSTLEARIKRAADSKDCTDMPWENEDAITMDDIAESAERYSIAGRCADCGDGHGEIETDSDDNETTKMEFDFDKDALTADAVLAKIEAEHDGVSERLDELRDAEETATVAEDAADALDLENVQELADKAEMLQDRNEELEERIDELQRPAMEEDAEFIAEHTDRYGDSADEVIENLDGDAEAVSDKRDLVEDVMSGYDEATANSGEDEPNEETGGARYATTPW